MRVRCGWDDDRGGPGRLEDPVDGVWRPATGVWVTVEAPGSRPNRENGPLDAPLPEGSGNRPGISGNTVRSARRGPSGGAIVPVHISGNPDPLVRGRRQRRPQRSRGRFTRRREARRLRDRAFANDRSRPPAGGLANDRYAVRPAGSGSGAGSGNARSMSPSVGGRPRSGRRVVDRPERGPDEVEVALDDPGLDLGQRASPPRRPP